jgi:hypothetical protein
MSYLYNVGGHDCDGSIVPQQAATKCAFSTAVFPDKQPLYGESPLLSKRSFIFGFLMPPTGNAFPLANNNRETPLKELLLTIDFSDTTQTHGYRHPCASGRTTPPSVGGRVFSPALARVRVNYS